MQSNPRIVSTQDCQVRLRNILFVCKGNICRSPLAACILRHSVSQIDSFAHFEVRSAGTEAYHEGKSAHPLAKKVAAENGYDLGDHVARRIKNEDVEWADLIVAMDRANVHRLFELFGEEAVAIKVRLFALLAGKAKDSQLDVLDPYNGPYLQFKQCFLDVQELCKQFVLRITIEDPLSFFE